MGKRRMLSDEAIPCKCGVMRFDDGDGDDDANKQAVKAGRCKKNTMMTSRQPRLARRNRARCAIPLPNEMTTRSMQQLRVPCPFFWRSD